MPINWYPTIKRFYDAGRYTKADVAVFVVAGWITPEQYQEITGDVYTPPAA
ncbi:XkdX family protein [Paenibacillus spongiae]|uniref:XkdX family protein n=1 Tax=Paenibacillus spongiae TaxID=2909671 RepID=A0ABY5SCG9_9BACL|nr:XkdX family protein [Paenibacillus spongiae]UVI31220.1 XkdX family protein [Paenibacillus spongiae]